MAEYIDREQALMQLTGSFPEDMSLEKYISLVIARLNKLPTADVIERSKINKAIEEIKEKSFKHYFELGEYIGEDTRHWEVIKLEDVLEILKKNIGE